MFKDFETLKFDHTLLFVLQEIAMKIIDSADNPSTENCFGFKTYTLYIKQFSQVQPSGVQCPEIEMDHKEIDTD